MAVVSRVDNKILVSSLRVLQLMNRTSSGAESGLPAVYEMRWPPCHVLVCFGVRFLVLGSVPEGFRMWVLP